VAGAALLGLFDKAHTGFGYGCPYALCLVPDNDINVRRCDYLTGCGNYVREQRTSADLVQHFGALRFEPGSFTRRHNNDGQVSGLRIMPRFLLIPAACPP
jgi:hypothetical protein